MADFRAKMHQKSISAGALPPDPAGGALTLNIPQTATDTTIEGEQETATKLSNGTTFNDLE